MVSTGRASIIEIFSVGFAVVNRRPWLIALPVLLDLFLWQGPRASVAPVIEYTLVAYERLIQGNPDLVAASGGTEQALEQAREAGTALAQGNLLHLLTWQLPSLANSLGTAVGESAAPPWQISSVPAVLLTTLALLVAGLLGTALYLGAVAWGVRDTQFSAGRYLHAVRLGWRRLLGFFGLLVLVGLPLGMVALVVLSVAGVLSLALLSFLSTLLLALLFLSALYLAFADEAIFMDDLGPVSALRQSVSVVSRFFWSAFAFVLLSNIITTGLTLIWMRLFSFHPAAGMVAILGHAYIATGLAAAAMVFYRNRVTLLSEAQRARGLPV